MDPSRLRSLFLVAALLATGCALSPGPRGGGMREVELHEIQASDADNVMDLLERIRPGWLYFHELRDPREASETQGPLVMINDVPARPLFTLQFIPLEGVQEIRYLTRSYARNRYRVNAPNGVILVITPDPVGPSPQVPPDTGRVLGGLERTDPELGDDVPGPSPKGASTPGWWCIRISPTASGSHRTTSIVTKNTWPGTAGT
jgi:hypothetical protein